MHEVIDRLAEKGDFKKLEELTGLTENDIKNTNKVNAEFRAFRNDKTLVGDTGKTKYQIWKENRNKPNNFKNLSKDLQDAVREGSILLRNYKENAEEVLCRKIQNEIRGIYERTRQLRPDNGQFESRSLGEGNEIIRGNGESNSRIRQEEQIKENGSENQRSVQKEIENNVNEIKDSYIEPDDITNRIPKDVYNIASFTNGLRDF